MKIVVGLGNPGAEYAPTRHNVGFRVVDGLARRLQARLVADAGDGEVAEAVLEGESVLLLKPATYMNRSGEALGALLDGLPEELPIEEVLVVTDDVHLPLGRMRARPGGSCGGHNGLASIEAALATAEYPRLRVGVGPEPADGRIEFVLGRFTRGEEAVLEEVIPAAVEAAVTWMRDGMDACRNRFNGWRPAEDTGAATTDEGENV